MAQLRHGVGMLVMFKSSRRARHRSFALIYTPPTNNRAQRSSKETISAATELSLDKAAELVEENLGFAQQRRS